MLLRLDQALALIDQTFAPVAATRRVALHEAAGAILAEAVAALAPLPLADNAAVDGYALRAADSAAGPAGFAVIGRAAAGRPFAGTLGPGEAVRIFTGAVVPAGADTVVMQEVAVTLEAGRVTLPAALRPGANIRRQGETLAPGAAVLAPGAVLTPLRLGLLADLGHAEVAVRLPLRVALLSSGDELVAVGTKPQAHQVIDSNRPMLRALLAQAGCIVNEYPIQPDDRATIAATLGTAARAHDLIVTTAGMSVGGEDHVRAILEAQGRVIFQRLALRPGRPVGLGLLGGAPVLGLPGNPGAAAVAFLLIGRPLLRRLGGAMPASLPRVTLAAGFTWAKPAGDRVYLPGRVTGGTVRRLAHNAASNLVWAAEADGLIDLPEAAQAIEPGTPVAFIPFAGAWP
ncbi:molybdopterin molybdotransferase MoeA [Oleomonas cavernae]|nr:gephyrin-like molybdotransferase Glp [Oleomonas cavernae]